MSYRHLITVHGLLSALCTVFLNACTQSGSEIITVSSSSRDSHGFVMPFAISSLPTPSDLKATLTCPDTSIVAMNIDLSNGTVSGSCTNVTAGTNKSITIDFTYTYGSIDLKLASASKNVDVMQGQTTSLSFAATDYDESFDADSDGYPNLYELTNDMDANSAATDNGFSTISTYTSSARAGHTATSLPDGTLLLLVCGS